MLAGGMNNLANPTGQRGVLPVSIKDMEFWPPGSIARRRGWIPYLASTVPEGASSAPLFDGFIWDRRVGSTRRIDLVARTAGGRLMRNRLYSGLSRSTANKWSSASTAFVRSTEGGQGFTRANLAYFSDGARSWGHASATPHTRFHLGLDAPTGTPTMNLASTASRIEPGLYEYTFTVYDAERNVESLPCGFIRPSTLFVFGSSTSWTRFYTMGKVPSLGYALGVHFGAMTLDAAASTVNIYRRHPFDLYDRPARRADDVRLVVSAAVASTSYLDKINDGELGDLLTNCGSSPRPWYACAEHQQRWLYAYASEPWKVWVSEPDAPEMVARDVTIAGVDTSPTLLGDSDPPFSGESWVALRRQAGPIMALVPTGSVTLVLCANQTWRFAGNSPGTYTLEPLDEHIGCVGRKAWVNTPYGVLWLSQAGVVWWRGERPGLVSRGWLDFDDSASDLRWNRDKLHMAVAAYDPSREVAEFAFPAYGSGGNDRVLAVSLGLSSPGRPVMAWHAPQLGTGETITSMVTFHPPTLSPFILYLTSGGRTLYRSGTQDDNGASRQGIGWRIDAWLGAQTWAKQHANAGLRLTHNAAYSAQVGCSLWTRETARRPAAGAAPTDAKAIVCSTNAYGATELGVQGNYIFMRLRETSSTPFEIQDVSPGWYDAGDWRSER